MRLHVTWCAVLAAGLLPAPRTAPAAAHPRAFCPPAPALAACTARRLATPRRWSAKELALDRAIYLAAFSLQVPLSAVLARPLPRVRIPDGVLTGAALLTRLAAARPGYGWCVRRGVVWFVQKSLARDPYNFLNWRLRGYWVRADVGENLLALGAALSFHPAQPPPGYYAVEGLLPRLAGGPLPPESLHGASAARILEHLLTAAPTFTSWVVFPSGPPQSVRQGLAALSDWQWIPQTRPPIPPPPPPPCGPIRVPRNAGPHWRPPPCPPHG